MARQAAVDRGLLEMALIGYETEKARIEAAIANIRAPVEWLRFWYCDVGSASGQRRTADPKKVQCCGETKDGGSTEEAMGRGSGQRRRNAQGQEETECRRT